MQKKLIFLLVFMVLVAILALQNSVEVEIKLWFWSVKTSMVLVLILTFAAGALAGILFSLPRKSGTRVKEVSKPEEKPAGYGAEDEPRNETSNEKKSRLNGMDEFEDIRS